LELTREQVHEQAIPPRSIRRTPVLAHEAGRTEANLLIGSDRRSVICRRVDREPMMSSLIDQVAGERSHRVGSKPVPLGLLGNEDVNPRVAKIGLVLLVVLDQTHEFALPFYRKRLIVVAPVGLATQLRLVRRSPPAGDAGLGLDLGHPLDIVHPERAQHHVPTAQERRAVDRTAHLRRLRSFHHMPSLAPQPHAFHTKIISEEEPNVPINRDCGTNKVSMGLSVAWISVAG
jgi:hypothetical protein